MRFLLILLGVLMSFQALAASKWNNCPGFYGESIFDVFRKSDMDGGNGPDFYLESGQKLSGVGSVCQTGAVFNEASWLAQMKSDLNPAKSVTAFRVIRSADDLHKFLTSLHVQIQDSQQLKKAVTAYLQGKKLDSVEEGTPQEVAENPFILVGSSPSQALIALTTSDGKTRAAKFMLVDRKPVRE